VRWLGAIVSLIVLAVVIFAMVFQWNWLRGPVSRYASARLHRQVQIHGDLNVHLWSWTPSATARQITVAEPAWAGKGDMAQLPQLTVGLDLKSLLFHGKMVLPVVDAEHPDVVLKRDATGRNNWTFGAPARTPQPLRLPPIRHFTINDGRLALDDARRRLHFIGRVSSNEQLTGWGRGRFTLVGRGALNRTPFLATVLGGPLINVDPNTSYPFRTDVRAGATHLIATGAIPHPFDLGDFHAALHVTGPDLADLYYLTGLTLPNTPPYDLAGALNRDEAQYDLTRIRGRVGSSDLAGKLTVREIDGRRNLTGDLASRRLKLADLTAVVGGAPRGVIKGSIASPIQRHQAAQLAAEHRILPDARLDVSRLRQMDGDVWYRAESVDGHPLPVRKVVIHAKLNHALLTVSPFSMLLPQGALSGNVRLDARRTPPAEVIDVRVAHARIQDLTPKVSGAPPVEGEVEARARLASVGESVRAAAGSANGVVAVAIPQGQMRQLFAELLGINVTKSLFMYLSKDNKPTPVRCAVAEFQARNGVLVAQRILLDTGVVQAQGKGYIDLRNETVNIAIAGKPKKFRLIRIAAPITIKGPLAAPKVGVDAGKAIGQIGIGAVLGALVSPLAVILPFIAPGTAKDADCSALLAEAATHGAPVGRG
jgi:hypothetical protein